MQLNMPIQYINGVGPKMAAKFSKLLVNNVGDILQFYPRTWLNLDEISNISSLRIGDTATIKATIEGIENQKTPRAKMIIIRATISDDSGKFYLTWFNQPFIENTIKIGKIYYINGRVSFDFINNSKIIQNPFLSETGGILPIYHETKGINSKYIRKIVKTVFEKTPCLEEYLPSIILERQKLISYDNAIKEIHFPKTSEKLTQAKHRLAFNELFNFVLRMLLIKKEVSNQTAPKINLDKNLLKTFAQSLPYQLTNAQKKVCWEIICDLTGNKIDNGRQIKPLTNTPMNRLLEGDVGSGKTVVAAMATLAVVKSGFKVVWMAPTEILATQHFNNLKDILSNFNCKISLLTSKKLAHSDELKVNKKTTSKEKILDSDIIIGTHALIQKDIKINNLGLVVIDEQHRFGVGQRAILQQNSKLTPHFLSMTATPIPRTLALVLYSNFDLSILDEIPPGRAKIITSLVSSTNRDKAYQFIREQINNGRQVFVICPLIEVSNKQQVTSNKLFDIERKSVKKEFERLSKTIFPDIKIEILHGKMRYQEKDKIMQDFKDKKIDILVSTSVIEVGIDIPNASIMMIEDADQFGLAQLHQFRGRVGRGQYQSYCLLFSNSLSNTINHRLEAMVNCSDGFKLAQKDLEIRGPGEFVGSLQHGFPDLKMATLTDTILINQAREEAQYIISEGIEKFPKINKFVLDQTKYEQL